MIFWQKMAGMPWVARLAPIALCLVAFVASCSNAALPGSSSNQGNDRVYNVVSPTSAVPTFPPVTIGAWVSNPSPQTGDIFTIYVMVRVQDAKMTGPSKPPNGSVQVSIQGNNVPAATASTNSNGVASFSVKATAPPTEPQTVIVKATVNGATYDARTNFTVIPNTYPWPTPPPTGT